MKKSAPLLSTAILGVAALLAAAPSQNATAPSPSPQPEKHLRNIKQLTFGGQNAEAYFSADGKKLIFQSTRDNVKCDQILIMNIDGSDQHMVSTGKGRTTCSYFFPDGKKILYSSTHLGNAECPPKPNRRSCGAMCNWRARPAGTCMSLTFQRPARSMRYVKLAATACA